MDITHYSALKNFEQFAQKCVQIWNECIQIYNKFEMCLNLRPQFCHICVQSHITLDITWHNSCSCCPKMTSSLRMNGFRQLQNAVKTPQVIQCIFMKHLLSPRTAAYGISSDNTEISYFQTYVNRKAQNGSFLTQEMRIWQHLTKPWQFASTRSIETEGLQYALCEGDKKTQCHTAWRPPQFSLLPSLWKREQNNLKTTTRAALSFTGSSQGAGWSLWLMKTSPQLLSANKRLTNTAPDPVTHKHKDAKPATNIKKNPAACLKALCNCGILIWRMN